MKDESAIGLYETPLEYIEAILREEIFEVEFHPETEEHPVEILYVRSAADKEGTPCVLSLYYLNDLWTASFGQEHEDDEMFLLRMDSVLPFSVPEERAGDMRKAILWFNRLMPVGALGFSEADSMVMFGYTLPLLEQDMDTELILGVIERIQFFLNMAYDLLKPLAGGEKSYADVVIMLKKEARLELGSVLPFPGVPE